MGFLDDLGGFLGDLGETLKPFFPANQAIATPGGETVVTEAGVFSPALMKRLMDIGLGAAGGELVGSMFGGGNGALVPKAGGVVIAGSTPGLYHTTVSGRRSPNRISFAQDDSGRADFFVHAGRPTAWSKVTLKKSRPRHHHHPR